MPVSFIDGLTYTYSEKTKDLTPLEIGDYSHLSGPSPSIIPLASHLLLTAGAFIASRYVNQPLQKRCLPAALLLVAAAIIHIWIFRETRYEDKLLFTLRSRCKETLRDGQFVLLETRGKGLYDTSGYMVRVYKDRITYRSRFDGFTVKDWEYHRVVDVNTALNATSLIPSSGP
jgi:hypothetical protein